MNAEDYAQKCFDYLVKTYGEKDKYDQDEIEKAMTEVYTNLGSAERKREVLRRILRLKVARLRMRRLNK